MKDEIDDSRREANVTSGDEPRIVNSVDLFDGRNELLIQHRGEQYRLRVTRQDKLILTK